MKYVSVVMFSVVLLTFGCRNNQPEMVNLPEDFVSFYDQFLKDSTYQMAHIQFPLEGLPSYVDSNTAAGGEFRWTTEDWVLNVPFDENNKQFERKFRQLTENVVEEIIYQKNGQLGTIRRFLKSDNEWKLIYFSGLNAMNIK